MANSRMKKMSNNANHQGNANLNKYTKRYHLTLSKWLSSKRAKITSVGKDVEKKEPSYIGGNENWCCHCRKQCGGFSKNSNLMTY